MIILILDGVGQFELELELEEAASLVIWSPSGKVDYNLGTYNLAPSHPEQKQKQKQNRKISCN